MQFGPIASVSAGLVMALGLGEAVDVFKPKPITVHSLEYEAGQIVQDRTVSTTGDVFYAAWSAKIVDAQTGAVVCRGQGSWHYETGRDAVRLPLQEWVGDPDCDLKPGAYIPVAAWLWGADQETHIGGRFVVE